MVLLNTETPNVTELWPFTAQCPVGCTEIRRPCGPLHVRLNFNKWSKIFLAFAAHNVLMQQSLWLMHCGAVFPGNPQDCMWLGMYSRQRFCSSSLSARSARNAVKQNFTKVSESDGYPRISLCDGRSLCSWLTVKLAKQQRRGRLSRRPVNFAVPAWLSRWHWRQCYLGDFT